MRNAKRHIATTVEMAAKNLRGEPGAEEGLGLSEQTPNALGTRKLTSNAGRAERVHRGYEVVVIPGM